MLTTFVISPLILLLLLTTGGSDMNEGRLSRSGRQLFFSLPNSPTVNSQYYTGGGGSSSHTQMVPLNLGDITNSNSPLYSFWSQLAASPSQNAYPYQHQIAPPPQSNPFFQSLQSQSHSSNPYSYYFLPVQSQHSSNYQPSQFFPAKTTTKPNYYNYAPAKEIKSPAPQGFNRGQIESRPQGHQGKSPASSGTVGFSRESVQSRPKPIVASNKSPFNRGAVEGGFPSPYNSGASKVVCYFASFASYREGAGQFLPEHIEPTLCTHLIYAFGTVDRRKDTIKEGDYHTDIELGFFRRTVELKKKNPNLKVLLSVGGWSDSGDDKYSKLANSPEKRRRFAQESKAYLKKHQFDGLAIDWHYPKCWQSNCEAGPDSDKEAFSFLIRDLKAAYGSELLVSATVSGYKEVIDIAYDVRTLSNYLDLMLVMSFDYHGSWEGVTGHISPLFQGPQNVDLYPHYNSNYTMNYFVSLGADPGKLIMGIPFYGQSFELRYPGDSGIGSETKGPGDAGEFTQQPGMLAYYEICERVRNKGWRSNPDFRGSWGPYAHSNSQWVSYDDPDMVRKKARFVKSGRFGGIFAWTMDLDDFRNDCRGQSRYPLLKTIAEEIMGGPINIPAEVETATMMPSPSQPGPSSTEPPTMSTSTTTTMKPWWTSTTTPSTTTQGWMPPSSTQGWMPPPSTQGWMPPSTTGWAPPSTTTTQAPSMTEESTTTSTTQMSTTTTQSPPTSTWWPQTSTHLPCQTQGTTSTPPNTNTRCNDWSFMPYPRDCFSYYRCSGGMLRLEQCPNGLEWDKNTLRCDFPYIAMCTRQTTTSTTTYRPQMTSESNSGMNCNPGEYLPAKNCDQYYLCDNGMKTLQSCGPGLHWNQEKMACDWPSSTNCAGHKSDTGYKNAPCNEGAYTGSDTDCSVYFVCVHGKNLMFRCQEGLYWNKDHMICDWKYNVQCPADENGGGGGGGGGGGSEPENENEMGGVGGGPDSGSESSTIDWIGTSSTSTTTRRTTTTTLAPWTPSSTTTQRSTTISTDNEMAPSATSFPPVSESQSQLNEDNFMIVCYFTNWAWYRPGTGKFVPEDINPDLCTHIVYGFAVLSYDDLVIKPHDSWADLDNNFYRRVVDFKAKGKKVTIAIGGWNDSQGDKYSRLVNNPAARRKFTTNVVDFIKKYSFDGLDLDWEYPKCWQTECNKGPSSDKPNFAAFVRELKEAFRPHGLLLSSAVSPSKVIIDEGYDVPTLSRYFDWISVMTYDYHGQWDKKTGHVAPLYFHEEDDFYYFNANYSINYWIKAGADRRKIVMGMPLYGQSFTLSNPSEHGLNAPASGGGTAGEFTRASGFLSYYEICANIQKKGWRVVQDEEGAMGPYAYKGNQWVSFDDVEMIKKKSNLIRDLDLGGGMIWALDLDDFRNTCGQGPYPLLTTIKNTLAPPRRPGSGPKPSGSDQKFGASINVNQNRYKPNVISNKPAPHQVKQEDPCDEPFKEHPSDCRKYYQCIHGRYREQTCPGGTYWNRDHCDWVCGSNNMGGSPSNTQRPTMRPTMRPTTRPTSRPEMTTRPPQSKPSTSRPGSTSRPMSTTTSKDDYCAQHWCPTRPPTTTTYRPVDVPKTEYMVVCYFTNWAWYRQGKGKYRPEDIDYNLCTHIAYGFAVLDPTKLTIRPHDGWADIDNHFYTDVAALKEKGVKVVIAIGGWNDSAGDKYSRLVRDAAARRKFISNVIEFIEKWKFEGLDLDWEYPKCWQVDCNKGPDEDKRNFAIFIKEIKEAFAPRGLTLSAAVSPSQKVIDGGYDVPAVSKYLDWISVMTYDYHGQWDKKTGHVAPFYHHAESENPLFNTNYTINYWIQQGADRKKIILGMPMYGQSFSLKDSKNTGLNSPAYGGGEAGEFTRQRGFLAYYEICTRIQKNGWTVVKDDSGAIGPYAYKGGQWVSYDDVSMIRRKSKYVKEMGLGGGMIWALDLDDFRGLCNCEEHPLLKTINRVLRNYPGVDPNC